MTPEIPETAGGKGRKRGWWIGLFGGSLWVAILLHVLFVGVATVIVVEHFQKKHINFQSTPPPAPNPDVEHKVELTKRNSVASAPPDLKRIVTTDISPITLPDVPETPTVDETTPTTMSGEGDTGEGMGNGNGNGNGSGGGAPDFGALTGGGFEGYFYDLKQTPDHQPTKMTEDKMISTIKEFCRGGWVDADLDNQFFKGPHPLFTNQIIIPLEFSLEGPKAFGLEQVCQPGFWLALYHLKVTPSHTGDYHLAGYGDDILIVQIDGDAVLDSGWQPPATTAGTTRTYPPTWAPPDIQAMGNMNGSRYAQTIVGDRFHLTAGKETAVDVLIGDGDLEGGSGQCGFFLYLLEDGKDYPKDATGFPIFPLFQVSPDTTVTRNGRYPPFTCKPEDALTQP